MITRSTTTLDNATRRALWAKRYYGSGNQRRSADAKQQTVRRDDRQSLHIDHGEGDPIPFTLDGAWSKIADITRETIRQRLRQLNDIEVSDGKLNRKHP